MVRKPPKILLHAVRQRAARHREAMLRVVPVPLLINLDALAHPSSTTRVSATTTIRDRIQRAYCARPGFALAPERSVWLMRAIPAPRKALRHPRLRRIILVDRRLGVHTHIRRCRCPHHVPDIRTRKLGIKVVGRLVRLDDGFERRRELFEREGRPVDVVEKGMFFQFGGAALCPETVFRVAVKELSKRN